MRRVFGMIALSVTSRAAGKSRARQGAFGEQLGARRCLRRQVRVCIDSLSGVAHVGS